MTEARPSFWLRPGFWRWMARLLVAGGLLLVSLVVWLLISPPSLAPVRGEIQGWLSQKLDRSVAFDELTWTWRQGLKVRVS
ncbi:MAG TPA: hypothetical protein VJ985_08885, partial [Gammaproteobacteria bacterium]|nr:hypothetical protein [Gammaproteobacteria bacterium]